MELPKGNVKNPAIRRIHADIRELRSNPSDQYYAEPLEENLFEWHFTLKGPPGTDFAGGTYHGRILLPPEYPFKPPNIMLLTPNGRFEVGKKICLSISAHHPEHWQPAWGIRLILEALISFFPTDPKGAVGSLDWTPAERSRLARESVTWSCPRCGPLATILKNTVGEGGGSSSSSAEDSAIGGGGAAAAPSPYAKEISQLYVRSASGEPTAGEPRPGDNTVTDGDVGEGEQSEGGSMTGSAAPPRRSDDARVVRAPQPRAGGGGARRAVPVVNVQVAAEEDKLLYVAIALFVVIVALLVRKMGRMADAPSF